MVIHAARRFTGGTDAGLRQALQVWRRVDAQGRLGSSGGSEVTQALS